MLRRLPRPRQDRRCQRSMRGASNCRRYTSVLRSYTRSRRSPEYRWQFLGSTWDRPCMSCRTCSGWSWRRHTTRHSKTAPQRNRARCKKLRLRHRTGIPCRSRRNRLDRTSEVTRCIALPRCNCRPQWQYLRSMPSPLRRRHRRRDRSNCHPAYSRTRHRTSNRRRHTARDFRAATRTPRAYKRRENRGCRRPGKNSYRRCCSSSHPARR